MSLMPGNEISPRSEARSQNKHCGLRLTPRLLCSLNAAIHMTPVKVPVLPASAFIHSLLQLWCSAAACTPLTSISVPLSPFHSVYIPLQRRAYALRPLLVCINCMGFITKALLAGWKEVKLNPSSLKQTSWI